MNGLGLTAVALTGLSGYALLTRSRWLPDAHPALRLAIGAALIWVMLVAVVSLFATSLQQSAPLAVTALVAMGGWAGVSIWQQQRAASETNTRLSHLTRQSLGVWLTLVVLLGHLALILAENLARPTTPWDAWTTWIYRGKAWFFDQALTPTRPSLDWLQQPAASLAVEAYQYPELVSVLSAVIATLDGQWLEASITLQGTLLAVVLCAAVYGSARTLGLPRGAALVTTTGMLSLPLVMSHLSLAGYADLWQALFSSTAMALLMIYALPERRHVRWLIAAIVLGSAGMWVKNEGAVWCLLTVGIALLTGPRTRLVTLSLLGLGVIVLGMMVWRAPFSVTVPGLGPFGIHDNLLRLGMLGDVNIAISPVLPAYVTQLITHQSFSILAPLLLLGLVGLWHRRHPLAMVATWIVLLPLATQLAIFGLTDYGAFALSATASGRLMLHFVPVWCVIAALGLNALVGGYTHIPDVGGNVEDAAVVCRIPKAGAAAGVALALALVGATAISWLGAQSPQRLQFTTEDLQILGGTYLRTTGGGLQFDAIQGAVGVMRAPLPNSDGKTLPLVITDVASPNTQGLAFFWRTTDGQLHSYPLTDDELPLLNLAGIPAWTNTPLVEAGLLQQPGVTVYPDILGFALTDRLSLTDWQSALTLWSQALPVDLRAVNALAPAEVPGLPSLNTLLCVSTVLLAALYVGSNALAGWRLHPHLLIAGFTTLGLIAVAQNVHRQVTGLQALDTPAAQLVQGATIAPIATQLKAATDEPVLITYFDTEYEFAARRLAYELLPVHAGVVAPSAIPDDWRGAIAVMAAADERRAALGQQLAGGFTSAHDEGHYLLLVPRRG